MCGAAGAEVGRVSRLGFYHRVAVALLFAACAGVTTAAESVAPDTSAPVATTNPPVRLVGNGVYDIGGVRLNKHERRVTFAAAVNARVETVEYALVHKTGKTHESIFRTETRPLDLQVALLLLGVNGSMTNAFGADGRAGPVGEKIWIQVAWTNQSQRVQCPLEDVVFNRETKTAMPRGAWIYNGSNFSEGSFTAQRDGSIVSIHTDADALCNNPRPGRENDDLYEPLAAKLPPVGTPVEIIFRLTPP